jgi:hypothetical protein
MDFCVIVEFAWFFNVVLWLGLFVGIVDIFCFCLMAHVLNFWIGTKYTILTGLLSSSAAQPQRIRRIQRRDAAKPAA